MLTLTSVSRERFLEKPSQSPFYKTFLSKATAYGLWESCCGLYNSVDELLGAMVVTHSKRKPQVTNLQLLFTFPEYRGQGVGSTLLKHAVDSGKNSGSAYFRVSSEPSSVIFYEKNGIKFWGNQKSGCSLALMKYAPEGNLVMEMDDFVTKSLISNRKGSLSSEEKERCFSKTGLYGA